MRTLLLSLFGSIVAAGAASATILINEVHLDPPNGTNPDDANVEFIELRSTTGAVESLDGLTLLIIDSNGTNRGEVEEAWDLTGLSTGTNGLILLGNSYTESPEGGPWAGSKDAATTVGDPSGSGIYSSMGNDDIGPNGGLTVLLVTGWTGLTNAAPTTLGDVDINNNAVLDWEEGAPPAGSQTTRPYTALVDSIGFRDDAGRAPYTTAVFATSGTAPNIATPSSIARRLSHTAQNSATGWYGGKIAGTASTGVAYDTFWGPFKGQVTPGRANLDSAPLPPTFLINEVSINPSGPTDGNYEFVEIINTVESNGTRAASLQGLTLLVIDSNFGNTGTNLGRVSEAWDLSSFSTGNNGLLLLGNNYTLGHTPWGNYIDPATQLGDPDASSSQYTSMGDGDIADNNGFTLLLVRGWSGNPGDDLDTNNDGIFDTVRWSAIVDSIGFDQVTTGSAGKTYAQGKVAVGYDPDLIARKLGNTAANSGAAWYGGDYGGNSPLSIGLKEPNVFGGFKGEATPGRANLSANAVAGPIRINEVHLDPVRQPDESYEYVELISTTRGVAGMNGLRLVVASALEGDAGRVLESIDLSGLSTGSNGLMIMGDGYDTFGPYQGQISPLTNREDPPGLDVNDFGPNSGLSIILVNAPVAVGSNVSAIPAGNIVDSISFGNPNNPAVSRVTPGFSPDNLSRLPNDLTPNSATAWYGGELTGSEDASLAYGSNTFGPFVGGGSPGRDNHAAPPTSLPILLNEININPPGGDNDREFIEIISASGAAVSTNGYSVLLIDVDGNDTGTVMHSWSLDGMATGTNGLLLLGAGYGSGSLPWTGAAAPAAATRLATPAGMRPNVIGGNANGPLLVLLVRNFAGRVGDDLDAGRPAGVADDGVFDSLNVSQIADSAGVRLWDTSLATPGLMGRVYSGTADLSQSGYTPDTLARHRGNFTSNSAAAWYGGDIVGGSGTSTAYDPNQRFPAGFPGAVTPGQLNVTLRNDTGDGDGDGVINLLEEAFGMNPDVSDAHRLPGAVLVQDGGSSYPAVVFRRLKNPAGLSYAVEVSTDLRTWSSAAGSTAQVSATDNGDGTETVTVRSTVAVGSAPQLFLRVRVTRG